MALVPSSCRHPVFTPSAAGDQFHALGFYSLAQIALGRAVRDSEPRHQITGALFSADDIGGGGRPPPSHEGHKNGGGGPAPPPFRRPRGPLGWPVLRTDP